MSTDGALTIDRHTEGAYGLIIASLEGHLRVTHTAHTLFWVTERICDRPKGEFLPVANRENEVENLETAVVVVVTAHGVVVPLDQAL